MPKLNTFLAAALAATTMITPVNAGQPGPAYTGNVHPGGYQSQSGYAGYGSSSYASASASSYASSNGYAYAGASAQAGLPNLTVNTNGPVDVIGDHIVCMVGPDEVPCDTVPGLAEALRLQGMNSIADQIPAYRGPAPGGSQIMAYNSAGYTGVTAAVPGYAGGGYVAPQSYATGTSYASASSSAYASSSSTSYASSSAYAGGGGRYYSSGTIGPAPTTYYAPPAPVTTSYGYGSEVWVTPCGQVITRPVAPPPCAAPPVRYVPPAPVSVRLSDGTVYALSGGVGAGVNGEFYGGGGTYIDGGARYSGVLSSYASRFTFKERKPRPKTRYPRPDTRYPKPKPRYHGGGKGGNGG